ncbi:endonuclease/exonuclease/phosphatase family protein [uncultured Lentibacter sp.]|uniref:endonuclease/exonuclease/phosphatase family protein n=1 Tax=uncultured Lentibacter sp. TaxID=1659309 RepID=UPI00262B518B|nr:endonuclease/exonuclease/phosphatase family protein [uncultured Lentibacter sp.]
MPAAPLLAKDLRIAFFNAGLSRKGPGLLMRDIARQEAQVLAARDVIARINPDILVLSDFDYDAEARALSAFAALLATAGAPYPYRFARRPNTGWATGLDMDGDGRLGTPRDAQGFGYFAGQGGLAVLSRFPFDAPRLQDFSALLWRDTPKALLPKHASGAPFPSAAALAAQRLSTTAHWSLPVSLSGGALTLLISQATPPVFDGVEDRNGKRNHDENALWLHHIEGRLGTPPSGPFVLAFGANLDPADGAGRRDVMHTLLAHPALQDPRPKSEGAALAATPGQRGDPALDTADWRDPTEDSFGPGNMRVDFLLPSADLAVKDAGVFWPAPQNAADHALALAASRHRLVWLDIRLP